MTLISILIALIIERLDAKGKYWQIYTYAKAYHEFSSQNFLLQKLIDKRITFILWLVLPCIAVMLVYHMVDFVLWQLMVNVLVLLVAMGCIYLRDKYKGYLNALQRDDAEAASLYAMQLGQKSQDGEPEKCESLGQTLAWINFRYYCTVIFWFVLLGPAGAVFYALVRTYADMVRTECDIEEENIESESNIKQYNKVLHTLLFWLDFLPARIASFGYLVIGNFNKGTSAWLKYLFDFKASNRKVVTKTAFAAEQVEKRHIGCSLEAACMVKLVKRNIIFMLVLIAVLTLFADLS